MENDRKRLTDNRYSNIAVLGNDSPWKLKKYQIKHGARLILLRRTLRKNASIASLVETLHVPDPIIPIYLADGNPNPEYDEYLCLLASMIMCCPNLEIFTGFQPFYNHTFDRLTHALSTRTKLKQHVWIISENDEVSERSQKQLAPGLLDEHQVYQFQQYHRHWRNLETLMLCSPAALGVLEHDIFVGVLHSLPRLQHLCVSSFDADDFNDITLFELPRLTSLRLEECDGVSDVGLAKWAASPSSVLVERLSLIHQNINSLATISKLFTGLDTLKKFTIMQSDVSPSLPLDMVVFPPLFANRTVERIHWDIGEEIFASTSQLNFDPNIRELDSFERATPNTQLALSILHYGFPALKTLRAPRDTCPPGVLQSVCRPARHANMLLPRDIYSTQKLYASKTSNSLQVARIRAQNLIDQSISANKEFVKVVVTDHTPPQDSRPDCPRAQTASSKSSTSSRSNTRTSTCTSVSESDPQLPPAKDLIRLAKEHRDSMLYQIALPQHQEQQQSSSSPTPPVRPCTYILPPAQKIHEFSLPTFVGRVSIHISETGQVYQPPRFDLRPHLPGRDQNGGIATWGELLKIKERVQNMQGMGRGEVYAGCLPGVPMAVAEEDALAEDEWIRDGCVGAWNKGRGLAQKSGRSSGKGDDEERWKHTERERMRRGRSVVVEDFF